MGTKVIKFFPSFGWFNGVVTSYDASVGWYKVFYEDGDVEELSQGQLEDVLLEGNYSDEYNFEEDDTDTISLLESADSLSINSNDRLTSKRKRSAHTSSSSDVPRQRRTTADMTAVNDLWKIHAVTIPTFVMHFSNGLHAANWDDTREQVAVADFFLFLHERQCIWERRNQGLPEPWSNHPVMNEYFFCNVYRELDRGTAFFHSHILDTRDTRNVWRPSDWIETVLWYSYCYRQANRLETFLETGFPSMENVDNFIGKLQRMKYDGKKYFSGAHQTGGLDRYCVNVRKIAQGKVIQRFSTQIAASESAKKCLEIIIRLPGIGSFLAWQIFCDLQESMCLPSLDDIGSFCVLGPGAIAALKIIFGERAENTNSQLSLASSLVKGQDLIFRALGLEFPYWN